MKHLSVIWGLGFLLIPVLLRSQSLTVVPPGELKVKREAFERAYESWREADSGLEKDLFQQPPTRVVERINNAAQKAQAFLVARGAYYDALIRQLEEQISLLNASAKTPGFRATEFKASIEQKLNALRAAKSDLLNLSEAEEDKTGTGSGPERILGRQQAQLQLRKLEDLQENLRRQLDYLDQAGATADLLDSSRSELLGSYENLLRLFTAEATQTKEEGALWGNYYEQLRDLVQQKESGKHSQEMPAPGFPKAESKAPTVQKR